MKHIEEYECNTFTIKISKAEAFEIANDITNDDLEVMFLNTMKGIDDWGEMSNVNKGLTKGTSWNIFAHQFNPELKYSYITKCNMVREFGDFLPDELRLKKVPSKTEVRVKTIHQEPNFSNWV